MNQNKTYNMIALYQAICNLGSNSLLAFFRQCFKIGFHINQKVSSSKSIRTYEYAKLKWWIAEIGEKNVCSFYHPLSSQRSSPKRQKLLSEWTQLPAEQDREEKGEEASKTKKEKDEEASWNLVEILDPCWDGWPVELVTKWKEQAFQ